MKVSLTGAVGEVLGFVTRGAESQVALRHSGAERSKEPGIHTPSAGVMDYALDASPRSGVTWEALTGRPSSPIVPGMFGLNLICGICREIIG